MNMKKLVTTMAVTATVAFAALSAVAPANAAPRHHHAKSSVTRPAGPGYYEGLYEYHVDRDDRASSPYNSF
jgi:hypothetical protein